MIASKFRSCVEVAIRIRPISKRSIPGLRTDQLDQYHTSVHGKRFAAGDTKVAVCIDCHSVHDIRPPSDPRSTVNPVNVAKTCSRCHSDADYMKSYGIPTDQFAKYNTSVHHDALAVRGDLSAPTCTTCHGNHGAVPPGVDKVQNVCANCHVFQAQMYVKSTHNKAFQDGACPAASYATAIMASSILRTRSLAPALTASA